MKPKQRRWHAAGSVVACVLLAACADPDVRIAAGEFGSEDTAAYLILSDQLQRVRNVLKKPSTVCAAIALHDGIAPVPPAVLDRLAGEQAENQIPLDVASNVECLVHYTRDKGPFVPVQTDILVLVRHQGRGYCGEWFGGMYNQGNLNRGVDYNVVVEQGIAHLTGGRSCASALWWYRT